MTDEITYYRRRAETELEQAQRAINPEAVRIHSALAEAYRDLVDQLEQGADRKAAANRAERKLPVEMADEELHVAGL